jgi:hypothetical protein
VNRTGRGQADGTCMLHRAARPGVLLTELIDRQSLPARVSVVRVARYAAELPSDRPQPPCVRYTIQTVIASTIVPTDSTTIVVGTSW